MTPRVSKKRIRYIRELWRHAREYGSIARREQALRIFIERIARISVPEFLTYRQASRAIDLLEKIQEKKTKWNREAVKMLLASLSRDQRKTLLKNFPFRSARDELIRDLKRKGVPYGLLAKGSGLGKTRIYMIISNKARKEVRLYDK